MPEKAFIGLDRPVPPEPPPRGHIREVATANEIVLRAVEIPGKRILTPHAEGGGEAGSPRLGHVGNGTEQIVAAGIRANMTAERASATEFPQCYLRVDALRIDSRRCRPHERVDHCGNRWRSADAISRLKHDPALPMLGASAATDLDGDGILDGVEDGRPVRGVRDQLVDLGRRRTIDVERHLDAHR